MRAFILFVLLVGTATAKPRTPACSESELNKLWPAVGQKTHFFKCIGLGIPLAVRCPENHVFNFKLQTCISVNDDNNLEQGIKQNETSNRDKIELPSPKTTPESHPTPKTPDEIKNKFILKAATSTSATMKPITPTKKLKLSISSGVPTPVTKDPIYPTPRSSSVMRKS